MAFIFAIQRCDRAPFYIFDEIDAALDPQYRSAVASLIRKEAADSNNQAQFITVTHKRELVSTGDKWFCVRADAKTKASTVEPLDSREEALQVRRSCCFGRFWPDTSISKVLALNPEAQ